MVIWNPREISTVIKVFKIEFTSFGKKKRILIFGKTLL